MCTDIDYFFLLYFFPLDISPALYSYQVMLQGYKKIFP